MTHGLILRSTLALLTGAAILMTGAGRASAFTYDTHVVNGDALGLTDSSQSSGGFQVHVTGGQSDAPAAGNSPFLSSSNPSIGSPVVPFSNGAGTMVPRFLYNH